MIWDLVVTGCRLAPMVSMVPTADGPAALIDDAVVAMADGIISWAGPSSAQPPGSARRVIDAGGRLVTPGLVDCHTHLVFGGHRADEYRRRLSGAGYEELARHGGGIMATVRATRATSEEELLGVARGRLGDLAANGVTTVEVKSGYGLDLDTELRMLRVARRLESETGVRVVTTFLGAHTVPEEFAGRPEDYIDYVCSIVLPAVAGSGPGSGLGSGPGSGLGSGPGSRLGSGPGSGLADAVDVFCDRVGFTADQAAVVLAAAQELGLPVKLHADQLSDAGGAALAARFGALSADHLEHTGTEGVAALAAAGTVAVLLPGAAYVLADTARPPVASLRAAGVPMAVATDANPGTSPLLSLPLAMHLACRLFGLTPEEALAGATCHAARALGLAGRVGVVAPGAAADLVVWDATEVTELVYWLGRSLCHALVRRGQVIEGPG